MTCGEDYDLLTELGVWDETHCDTPCVFASEQDARLYEAILLVVSSGGFPKSGERANLSKGLRNHLRDALILEAHVRHGRHVFVTADRRAFIHYGHREVLQDLCRTVIVEPSELGTTVN